MGKTTRLRQGVIGGIAAVLLLTGCTAGGAGDDSATPGPTGGGDSTPSAGATPSSTPAPDDSAASPVTEIDLDCAALLDSATASALQPEWTPRDYYARADAVPADYAIAQEGGLICTWNDGAASDGKNNPVPGSDYTGLLVQVLPHAAEQYAQLVATYGEKTEPDCYDNMSVENQGTAGCTHDMLIGDTWVSMLATGLVVPEGGSNEKVFAPAVRSVTDAVTGADVSDDPWPLGGALPGFTCNADAPVDGAALGIDDEVQLVLPGGGYSIYAAAWQRAAASNCFVSVADGGADAAVDSVADESLLVGGAWALDQRLEFGHVDASSAVEVPGLASGDRAYRTCAETCITDLVLGDDWVRLTVHPVAVPDVEAASEALAADYVARAAA
ncbi:hypothetical protein [Frigoribacterium sp. CFBP9030]|uniref:hypothetical protein n=1 Tax=Frigoribacterium sp. CFBP9030 TaxID=3096537 RepID=UPI002A6A1B44|nr:hypothetical protein [Frigoribacterium sp. CFBP9030]MDY0891752.1 hypothetical protein [Frigoribacterium sp. CFBP9030]